MKRTTVLFILLIVWIAGGCALNASKRKAAKPPRIETAEPARTEAGDTAKTRGAERPTDPHHGDEPATGEDGARSAEKKPSARKTSAALTIYFKENSNELASSETAKLDKVAETLRRNPQARVTLTGYTDSAGSKAYNRMVAQGRASSVKFYLVAKGVDPKRLAIVAKGASEFAADNDTDEGRNLNRRVEIKIQTKR